MPVTPSGAPYRLQPVKGRDATRRDGSVRLDRAFIIAGQALERRTRVTHKIDPHAYRANLTDAFGRVVGEAHETPFDLSYR